MFRWRQSETGVWEGAEGDAWYEISQRGDQLSVRSSHGPDQLAAFLRLDWDSRAVEREICERGPELGPYLAAAKGLRLLRYSNPVETIFTFLCTANNHIARIGAMVNKLAAYGEPLEGSTQRRFPSLERLAALSEAELRFAGFGYRAASLPRVAAELLARGGEPYVKGLKQIEFGQAREELIQLPSIGPKLADCIALFGLDFSQSVPVDTHIWQAATRLYLPHHDGTSLTPQKYREFTTLFQNRFGHLSGWAHQALFFDNLVNWRSRKSASM